MNYDIAYRISTFIDPNPVQYTRLALVCRDFYKVFTSDAKWKYLDPLDHQTGIMRKFLERSTPHSRQDIRLSWELRHRPATDEPLAWLAYYTSSYSYQTTCPTSHKLIWCALNISHYAIFRLDPHVALDRECAIAAATTYGPALRLLPRKYWNDKQVIKASCSKPYDTFCGLELASHDLRDDPDLVAAAVFQDGIAMDYASKRLRTNREFVLQCIAFSGDAIEFTDFFSDREIVATAVKTYGKALERAIKFQDDAPIVEQAVRNDGLALQFASTRLRGSRNIVYFAVQQNPAALNYAPKFLCDREIVLMAIRNSCDAFTIASPTLQHDRSFVLEAVASNAWCLYRIPVKYLYDREVLLQAIDQNGELYTHMPGFRDDHEFYKRAVATYPKANDWAPEKFRVSA